MTSHPYPRRIFRPAYLERRIPRKSRGDKDSGNEMGNASSAPTGSRDSPYYPDAYDVLRVRRMLQNAVRENATASGGLPTELVDMIIDRAEYWPSVEVKMTAPIKINQDGDRECLRTGPLCYATPKGSNTPRLQPYRDIHPCRKVEFTILSHDQGWGGGPGTRGTYHGSYSWFDAYIISRPDRADPTRPPHADRAAENSSTSSNSNSDGASKDGKQKAESDAANSDDEKVRFARHNYFLPNAHTLQRNVVAQREVQTHKITWHYLDSVDPDSAEAEEIQNSHGRGSATLDGRAVRKMHVGDEISVWGRARFPGWSNTVEGMSIRVFWAI
ncbi:hypothetical protein VTO42DRAFT_666 [Malbranchea cinnamomea]